MTSLGRALAAAVLCAACKERPPPLTAPPAPVADAPAVVAPVADESDRTLEASLAKLEKLRSEQLARPDAAVAAPSPQKPAPAEPTAVEAKGSAAPKWAEATALARQERVTEALTAARDAWALESGPALSADGLQALVAVRDAALKHDDDRWDSGCERMVTVLEGLPQGDDNARPVLAMLWSYLASRALAARDVDRARQLAQRALQLEEVFPAAFSVLGRAAYLATDFDEAEKFYDRAARGCTEAHHARRFRAIIEKIQKERATLPTGRRATKDFIVLYDPREDEEAARVTLEALQLARTQVGAIYDGYPTWPIAVVLLSTESFQRASHASWAAAFYDGRVKMPSQGAVANPLLFRQTLFHEYAHGVFDYVTHGVRDSPGWLNEGFASVAGDLPSPSPLGGCRLGHTFPIRQLEKGFWSLGGGREAHASYLEARHAAEQLQQTFGAARVQQLFGHIAQEQHFAPAFEKAFGLTYAQWAERFDGEKEQ